MSRPSLPPLHLLLILLVVAIWGLNFVVVKVALEELPPLTLAALRFALAVFPAILFLKRPATRWRMLALYGLLIGVGQFGLLFIALKGHISPGLASLVAQTQAFFTIALAARFGGERLRGHQLAALTLAAVGLGWLMLHARADMTALGLLLTLLSAGSWAFGNMVARVAPGVNMVAFVAWASVFSAPPLFALAVLFEGWPAVSQSIAHASPHTWLAVCWQAFGNSLFGFAVWGWMLSRHPAATVSPFALLIPVFGMAGSWFWLGEALPAWKLTAAGLVLGGLAVNIHWPQLAAKAQVWPAKLALRWRRA